jgi:hypothetical protein
VFPKPAPSAAEVAAKKKRDDAVRKNQSEAAKLAHQKRRIVQQLQEAQAKMRADLKASTMSYPPADERTYMRLVKQCVIDDIEGRRGIFPDYSQFGISWKTAHMDVVNVNIQTRRECYRAQVVANWMGTATMPTPEQFKIPGLVAINLQIEVADERAMLKLAAREPEKAKTQ